MGVNCFTNPKDVSILMSIMQSIGLQNGDIVLDFFGGSSSTAHAVMQLNLEIDKKCSFIMVQMQENLENLLGKAVGSSRQILMNAIELCDKLQAPHVLTEIGKERIRLAGAKIEEEQAKKTDLFTEREKKLDTGFRVFKLDSTNMKDVYYSAGEYQQKDLLDLISNIKDDRTDLDLLYGCLIDWGVPLSLPHKQEKINGQTVHFVNETDLIACFDENVSEETICTVAKRKPIRVVFRDASFKDSADRINVTEIFKAISPETTVKVI
jgi:adenine-specific DNA-methyltransferase